MEASSTAADRIHECPVRYLGDVTMIVQCLISLHPAQDDWRTFLDGDYIDVPDCGNSQQADFQRGIYRIENGKFVVESTGNQSSGAFRSMSLANCFVVLERERGRVEVGETVQIQLFNPTLY